MTHDNKSILKLQSLLKRGYKIIGHYRRNSNYIYLKRGKEVALPFSMDDSSFNKGRLK
jgi:predicted GNAT superfamily acetyltransferase